MGVFGYADDLSLLCPSFSDMREMLNVCERYAGENKILFNASKIQILHFSKMKIQRITGSQTYA